MTKSTAVAASIKTHPRDEVVALRLVRAAVKANLLPGMVLWSGLVVLLMAYAWSPAVRSGLAQWGTVKMAWGYPFAFASYVLFAVLVPEALSHVVLKHPWARTAGADMLYAAILFIRPCRIT